MRAASLLLVCLCLAFASTTFAQCYSANLTCLAVDSQFSCGSYLDTTANVSANFECPPSQYCSGATSTVRGNCTNYVAPNTVCFDPTNGISAIGTCTTGYACTGDALPYNCTQITVVAIGDACSATNTARKCPTNAYCNATTGGACTATVAIGASCSSSLLNQCGPGGFCVNSTCVAGYSLSSGGLCGTPANGAVPAIASAQTCDVGFACSTTNVTCFTPAASSLISCNGSTDVTTCRTDEYCACTAPGATTYNCVSLYAANTQTQKTNWQAYWTCQKSNTQNVCSDNSTCNNCRSQACTVGVLAAIDTCGRGVCAAAPATTGSTGTTQATSTGTGSTGASTGSAATGSTGTGSTGTTTSGSAALAPVSFVAFVFALFIAM